MQVENWRSYSYVWQTHNRVLFIFIMPDCQLCSRSIDKLENTICFFMITEECNTSISTHCAMLLKMTATPVHNYCVSWLLAFCAYKPVLLTCKCISIQENSSLVSCPWREYFKASSAQSVFQKVGNLIMLPLNIDNFAVLECMATSSVNERWQDEVRKSLSSCISLNTEKCC